MQEKLGKELEYVENGNLKKFQYELQKIKIRIAKIGEDETEIIKEGVQSHRVLDPDGQNAQERL